MRHPLIEASDTTFRREWRQGWVRLDMRSLDRLTELSDATVTGILRAKHDVDDLPDVVRSLGYAEGVRDAIGWLAKGHQSPDRLADLLDIDSDQR